MSEAAHKMADALGSAIASRDAEAVRALYSPDIAVWHAMTNAEQSRDENVGLLAGVFAITSELEYKDIRRHDIEGGIVQQHRLTGTFDDGSPLPDLHACLVIKIADGKITLIDEYFDSPAFATVWERLAALQG